LPARSSERSRTGMVLRRFDGPLGPKPPTRAGLLRLPHPRGYYIHVVTTTVIRIWQIHGCPEASPPGTYRNDQVKATLRRKWLPALLRALCFPETARGPADKLWSHLESWLTGLLGHLTQVSARQKIAILQGLGPFSTNAGPLSPVAMLAGLRALRLAWSGPDPLILPVDLTFRRGHPGPAASDWIRRCDCFMTVQAKQATGIMRTVRDSIPSWVIINAHRGQRSLNITDLLRRPQERLLEATVSRLSTFWGLVSHAQW
jgi:hypothetical protein